MPELRKTKIICTLGPSVDDEGDPAPADSGWHERGKIQLFPWHARVPAGHAAKAEAGADELGRPVATILDTKGPEIRIKAFRDGPVSLERGAPSS